MKTKLFILALVILTFGCNNESRLKANKFTAINPLSYTAVKYVKDNDEVLTTTYDGSIYKIDKSGLKSLVLKIDDEIYDIEYLKSKDMAYLATYKSGIIAIDIEQKKIIKELPINNKKWLVDIQLSENGKYLSGIDVKYNNHIWDVENDYNKIDISEALPNNYIRYIDNKGLAYFQTAGKYNVWHIEEARIIGEIPIQGKFLDIDEYGNIVALHDNQFFFYDKASNSVKYTKKHPYLIFEEVNGDTIHDPYQLKLLDVKFAKDKILSVGLDKSIRVWDKETGNLVNEWNANKATISGLDISKDQSQIVTSDLKGHVVFKDLVN